MRLLRRVEYEAVYGAGQRRSSPQFAVFFRSQQATARASRANDGNKAAGPRPRQPLRHQRQESPGWRGGAESHSPPHPRNPAAQQDGDSFGMGHRDSSAALGGAGAFRASGGGTGAPAPQYRPERAEAAVEPNAPALLLLAVRVYQTFFSALMPSACKFYPSCSQYAADARATSWRASRLVARVAASCALPSIHARRRGPGARCRGFSARWQQPPARQAIHENSGNEVRS